MGGVRERALKNDTLIFGLSSWVNGKVTEMEKGRQEGEEQGSHQPR